MKRIAWLPAHPAMGWASMNRCWHVLHQQASLVPCPGVRFSCPLELAPIQQAEAPLWARRWARNVSYPWIVSKLRGVDAVHVLDHSFADLLKHVPSSVKKLVTVHDIIPLLDAGELTTAQVTRFRARMMWLNQADVILCVSDFTKQTLINALALDERKLRVIHNGVELPVKVPQPLALAPARPWILIVGVNAERKNLRLVPKVLRELRTQGVLPSVVRIGPALQPEISAAIRQEVGDACLVEMGLVSDEVLASAYASADLLFFPSRLEGFGLPVVEAMSHGCPVVCAQTSSLPEVAGDAALYFDPDDAAGAARQCIQALTDAHALGAKGQQRARLFTWAEHWRKICEVYREVLAA